MGVEEIISKIKEEDLLEVLFHGDYEYLTESQSDYGYEREGIETEEDVQKYLDSLGLGNFKNMDSRTDTSEFWSVVYFPDYDVYLKITGWFDSYEMYNHDYTNIKQVFPKEVTKFIYQDEQ